MKMKKARKMLIETETGLRSVLMRRMDGMMITARNRSIPAINCQLLTKTVHPSNRMFMDMMGLGMLVVLKLEIDLVLV